MSEIQFKNPPADRPRRCDIVARQLRERPGEWAFLETSPPFAVLPWWNPIAQDEDNFEIKYVKQPGSHSGLLGPRDVYARYIGGVAPDVAETPDTTHPGSLLVWAEAAEDIQTGTVIEVRVNPQNGRAFAFVKQQQP